MSQHRVNCFDGGVVPSNSAAVAGAIMERDPSNNSAVGGFVANNFLETLGALFLQGLAYTAAATLGETTTVAQANASGGAFTLTLPPVATVANQVYLIFKTDSSANVPTIEGNGAETINGANTYAGLTAQYAAVLIWANSTGTAWYALHLDPAGGHRTITGPAPTAAAGSNAGTSPPAPVVAASSNDNAGTITGGTGTTPAAGNLITVTFNTPFAAAPKVIVGANNAASAALLPYVTSVTTTGFTIATQAAPAGGQVNTTYAFTWHAIG